MPTLRPFLPFFADKHLAVLFAALEVMGNPLHWPVGCYAHDALHVLQAILHASLDRSLFSIDKFSRWLRAICSMLLSRNSAADRAKAIGYVEQAIHVIENQATDAESEVLRFSGISCSQLMTNSHYRTIRWTNDSGCSAHRTILALNVYSPLSSNPNIGK